MHKYKYFIAYGQGINIYKNYDYENTKPISEDRHFFWEGYQKNLFDGVLISKEALSKSTCKKIIEMGGVHKYLNLGKHVPIMADNGAFTHINKPVPQSTPEEIFNYFIDLKFSSGITLDHIITDFTIENNNPTEDMIYRQNITIENARKMFEMKKKSGSDVELYAAIQGWDVKSTRHCIEEMAKIGFTHIAIGGIARQSSEVIKTLFNGIWDVINKNNLKIHALGCTKLDVAQFLAEKNVISGDSTSYIKYAVKDYDNGIMCPTEKRYVTPFIPLPRSIKDSEDVMKSMNDYQKGLIDLKQTASKIKLYLETHLKKPDWLLNKRTFDRFIKALDEPMWKTCGCPACNKLGVNIFAARTSQYNAMRGFHNLWNNYKVFVNAQTSNSHKLKSFLGA